MEDASEHCGAEIFLLNPRQVWGQWGLGKGQMKCPETPIARVQYLSWSWSCPAFVLCPYSAEEERGSSRTRRGVGGLETVWQGRLKKSGMSLGDIGRRGRSCKWHLRCHSCLVLPRVMKMAASCTLLLPSLAFPERESCRIPPRRLYLRKARLSLCQDNCNNAYCIHLEGQG